MFFDCVGVCDLLDDLLDAFLDVALEATRLTDAKHFLELRRLVLVAAGHVTAQLLEILKALSAKLAFELLT